MFHHFFGSLFSTEEFGIERNLSVVDGQLEVSPSTEGVHDGHLAFKYFLSPLNVAGVGGLDKVVAVVDDGVVILRLVVGVVSTCREIGQSLQVGGSIGCKRYQIAAHFAKQVGLVCHFLHQGYHTHYTIERVVHRIQPVVFFVHYHIRFRIEHVLTTGGCEKQRAYGDTI